ncbi:MAG: hypothetical protein IJL92_07170, partial [Thermoguttaceae bacterium]|nr:hypothetical protein [Thermoguttaceae bacterium]
LPPPPKLKPPRKPGGPLTPPGGPGTGPGSGPLTPPGYDHGGGPRIPHSIDPNEINGPVGADFTTHDAGTEDEPYLVIDGKNWVDASEQEFRIYFENKSTAEAAAQEVFVRMTLPELLDENSLQITDINIGDEVYALTPEYELGTNVWLFKQVSTGDYIKVSFDYNSQTRQAKWYLRSYVLSTYDNYPSNAYDGFLPPNDKETGDGEGYVSFTVSPKAGLETGTRIETSATIVFDANAPIDTNVWVNTLDVDAPTLTSVTAQYDESTRAFTVNWSGEDADSGVGSYDVFCSVDGGETFVRWLANTTDASGVYTVPEVSSGNYVFKAVVYDGAGNNAEGVTSATTVDAAATDVVKPNNLTIGGFNAQTGSFVVNWTDNSTGENGYLIEASTDGGATWTPIAQADADANSATLSGLNGSFTLRVSAFNDAGASDYVYAQVWNLADFNSYQAFALTSPEEGTVVLNGVNSDGSYTPLETRELGDDFYACVLGRKLTPEDFRIASDAASRLSRIDFVDTVRNNTITVDGTDEGDMFFIGSEIVETSEQVFTQNPYEKVLEYYAGQFGENSASYLRLKAQYDKAYADLAKVVKTTKTTWGTISIEGGANVRFMGAKTVAINAGDGDDYIQIDSMRNNYVLTGGEGYDMINFLEAEHGINVDLGAINAPQAAIVGDGGRLTLTDEIEMLYGSRFADRIVGSKNGSAIVGHGGADSITLVGGTNSAVLDGRSLSVVARGSGTYEIMLNEADYSTINVAGVSGDSLVKLDSMYSDRITLFGGPSTLEAYIEGDYATINANDSRQATVEIVGDHASVTTGQGDDSVRVVGDYGIAVVGAGNDVVEVVGAKAGVLLGDGDDAAYLSDGTSGLVGGSAVYAGDGNDFVSLANASGSNTVVVGIGNDVVLGSTGNDVIYGVAGINALFGLGGADKIFGGSGRDLIFAAQPPKLDEVDKNDREELTALYASVYENWVVENDLEATLDLLGSQCEPDGEEDTLFAQSVDQVFASELDGDVVNGKIWKEN